MTSALVGTPWFYNFCHSLKNFIGSSELFFPIDHFVSNHMLQKPFFLVLHPISKIILSKILMPPFRFPKLFVGWTFIIIIVIDGGIKLGHKFRVLRILFIHSAVFRIHLWYFNNNIIRIRLFMDITTHILSLKYQWQISLKHPPIAHFILFGHYININDCENS